MKRLTIVLLAAMAMSGPALAQTPVKIGFITTLSTPAGVIGKEILQGFETAVKQEGGKLGGVPVEVVVADDGINPNTAKDTLARMLQRDNIKMFTGVVFSVVGLAIVPDMMRANAYFVSANTAPVDFDGKHCHPNYFVASWNNEAQHDAAGIAATEAGSKRAVTIAANYYAGKESVNAFKRTYKGQVLEELLPQLNQTDYAAEISQIKAAKPDGIYSFLPGGMGTSFLRQMRQAGLTNITQYNGTTLDITVLNTVGDGFNVIGTTFWGPEMDNPANKKFVADYAATYKSTPTKNSAQGYEAARMIGEGLRDSKGDLSNVAAVRNGLRSTRFESIRGKFSLGKSRHPIQDWYETRAVRDGGEIVLKLGRKLLSDYDTPYASECMQ